MAETTENLAAALRRCVDTLRWYSINAEGNSAETPDPDDVEACNMADAALTAWEAEQAAHKPRAGMADALRAIIADVDAPGHTIRSIRAESVAAAREALDAWETAQLPPPACGPAPQGRL